MVVILFNISLHHQTNEKKIKMEKAIKTTAKNLFSKNKNADYDTIVEMILKQYPNVDMMKVLCAIEDAFGEIN